MRWKRRSVGARIFHYEYSIMSSRLCQEKFEQHPEKRYCKGNS